MFDPDVLDPLVKEHGIAKYGLIIRFVSRFFFLPLYETKFNYFLIFRMEFLAGIALYEDIAMYEHKATTR